MTIETSDRPKVFISYSHRDREWLERLRVHLKPLKGTIDAWDDTRIDPGSLWREEIHQALAAARAAILLVSADFVASDFILAEELPALLKSARGSGTDILVIVLSPAMISAIEGLSEFQTVNDPRTPIIGMERVKQEQVFLSVAYLIELALRRQAQAPAPPPAAAPAAGDDPGDAPAPASDCRDYATIFDIHIKRERKTMPLTYAAVVLTPLVGLALILAAWLMIDIKQHPAVVGAAVALGLASFGLSYVLTIRVRDRYTAIESCEFMKRKFDGCERWDAAQLREHVRLALEFLRKGMLKS